ncbi:endolytic transglycosylase MltG [Arcobacteraceae bacterium]|nr:endolytic transglycosylase MltG [Arcobacteraceae bacterium]
MVFNIVELFLAVIIILSFYFIQEVNTSRVVFIPKGSSNSIVAHLDKNNYEVNLLDKIMLRFIGKPQSGWIDLKTKKMSKIEFLYRITTSKAALKKVTLIPGETYYFFLQNLAKTLDISTYKLFQTYARLGYKKDGNIIADTYYLPYGMDEEQLIKHLLAITERKYEKLSQKIFGEYNRENWYKYVTIASIIQKESASKEEMAIVSSVIYNRLKKNMKLQMDGTLNYSKYSHTKVTPSMIKNDKTDYNTYKNKGLPSDPVCAIEFEAIKAAIFPVKSNYLYFMKSVDGTKHDFSSSYKKHKQNIRKVQREKRKSKKQTVKNKKTKKIKKVKKTKSTKTPKIVKKKISKGDKLKNLWK